jgi:hypothetical protein
MQVEGVNPLQLDLEAGIGVIDVFRAGSGGSLTGPNAPASRPAPVPDGGGR